MDGGGAGRVHEVQGPQAAVEERVRDLMSRMTLAEKIGQMTQIERRVSSADVIHKYLIGRCK